ADEIAERDGELAALGGVLVGSADRWSSLGWRCFQTRIGAQPGDGVEQLTAVPDNIYAKGLQILCPQAREDCVVDLVLAECRLILSEAKAPQPIAEVHAGPRTPPGPYDHPGETTCLDHCFRKDRYGHSRRLGLVWHVRLRGTGDVAGVGIGVV